MAKKHTKVWIDTVSGTWGEVVGKNGSLVIVDLTEQAATDTKAGVPTDEFSIFAFLESASDSEIADYGLTNGRIAE